MPFSGGEAEDDVDLGHGYRPLALPRTEVRRRPLGREACVIDAPVAAP
ncbi:hypothetical protein AB0I00_10115 [Streptomyces sp. NPDC050803]